MNLENANICVGVIGKKNVAFLECGSSADLHKGYNHQKDIDNEQKPEEAEVRLNAGPEMRLNLLHRIVPELGVAHRIPDNVLGFDGAKADEVEGALPPIGARLAALLLDDLLQFGFDAHAGRQELRQRTQR